MYHICVACEYMMQLPNDIFNSGCPFTAARVLTLTAACLLPAGWMSVTLQVWSGLRFTGDTSTFNVTSVYFDGSPAAFPIP